MRILLAGETETGKAGSFNRLLGIHPELNDVEEDLEHRLGLPVVPRGADRHDRLPLLEYERGVRRQPRALAGGQRIGMLSVQSTLASASGYVKPQLRHNWIPHVAVTGSR